MCVWHHIAMHVKNILLSFFITACVSNEDKLASVAPLEETVKSTQPSTYNQSAKTVHVLVALCDNKYQGIVKVPEGIGNGQKPSTNLYWGAGYGLSSFFKRKDSDWQFLQQFTHSSDTILDRLLFKHKKEDIFLLADAYDDRYIKNATVDFLRIAAGYDPVTINWDHKKLYFGGVSSVVTYIGHDGLMDFSIKDQFVPADTLQRQAIILACYSKHFFKSHLQQTGAYPLLWTTHLMAPEAYILHAALQQWVKKASNETIADAAAIAYDRYQKCGLKAARRLLVSGW